MANRILVVDNETEIAGLIEAYLAGENCILFKFYLAAGALACINTAELDLAILDVMMPEIDGFALCQKMREKHTWPIIMLTDKDEETDKITGLTLGAGEYVAKPFRPPELMARVKSNCAGIRDTIQPAATAENRLPPSRQTRSSAAN